MAKSRTGGLIKNYRDHNGMLNDAVLAALAHIAETTNQLRKRLPNPGLPGSRRNPK
jgi:hypothetical protein